jgi:hypothetical protein
MNEKRYVINVYWREAMDDQPSSHWYDVVEWHYPTKDTLVFKTPTETIHHLNVNATQLITIMEKSK